MAERRRGRASSFSGAGTILREVIAAAELLENDFGVAADIWSCPSFNELRRDGIEAERWNLLASDARRRARATSSNASTGAQGPVIAATRLHARLRRADPAVCAAALSCASAPTVSAAATIGWRCASFSKLTATTSWSQRSSRWPTKGRCRNRKLPTAIATYGIDRGAASALEDVKTEWKRESSAASRALRLVDRVRAVRMGEIRQVCRSRHRRLQGRSDHRDIGEAGRPRDRPRRRLITLESDKASMEVPSPSAGAVK